MSSIKKTTTLKFQAGHSRFSLQDLLLVFSSQWQNRHCVATLRVTLRLILQLIYECQRWSFSAQCFGACIYRLFIRQLESISLWNWPPLCEGEFLLSSYSRLGLVEHWLAQSNSMHASSCIRSDFLYSWRPVQQHARFVVHPIRPFVFLTSSPTTDLKITG